MSSLVWFNTFADVRVLPSKGLSVFGISSDVSHEFAAEILHRVEDAARDYVSLDSSEPDFHLVQPGGVCGGEMQFNLGVRLQELGDLFRLVSGQVVHDNVDLLLRFAQGDHLTEKVDELLTGMTGCCLAVHLAGFNIQRGIQRERAMPVVFKSMPLNSAGR